MQNQGFGINWKIFGYSVVVIFTLMTILPLIWLFYSSFKPHEDIVRNVFSFPKEFFIDNFQRAWKVGNLGIYSINSVIYTTVSTSITTFLALSAGYGLAKFGYKISGVLVAFVGMGLLITIHSVLVPLYVIESRLNIDDTRLGVIIPYIAFGLPFLLYIATSFIKDLPDALEEAAIIDGAGYLTIFRTIILPLSRPVVATMIIFSFLANWNEFALVFILTSDKAIRSLPVGINSFAGGKTRDYGLQFAALIIGTLPMIIMYIFSRQQLTKGFSAGAIKE